MATCIARGIEASVARSSLDDASDAAIGEPARADSVVAGQDGRSSSRNTPLGRSDRGIASLLCGVGARKNEE